MIERAQVEFTASVNQMGVFFKCPVGGFASLNPGLCPKCQEVLQPITGSTSASGNVETARLDVSAQSKASEETGAVN